MRTLTATVVLTGLAGLTGLTGCDDGDDWDPPAQFAPSLRPAFGARVTDGELRFWTGTPCHGLTRVRVVFDAGTSASTTRELTGPPRGADLDRFAPLGRVPGFSVVEELPADFAWQQADRVSLGGTGGDFHWGASVPIAAVVEDSPEHPEDTYYFDEVGWLDADEVAEQNGVTFLTPCTPDPEE